MIKNVKYILTTHKIENLPSDSIPEIVIVGKSNVGKSSLINVLTNQKIAYVGKKPGKTRSISLFDVDKKFRLVDIPGYGYAKVSRSQIELFSNMIDDYLSKRKNLIHAILLIDSRRGITELDGETINYFLEINLPFSIIGTKSDKLNQSLKHKFNKNIIDTIGATPLLISSTTKDNIELLKEHIVNIVNN